MLSRVADCLYWMSRYIERAENNARLLEVNMQLLLDFENQTEAVARQHWLPILNSLEDEDLFNKFYTHADGDSVVEFVTFEPKNPNSIFSCLSRARENARCVREQISSEMWEQLNGLYLFICSAEAREMLKSSAYQFFQRIREGSHLFIGITDVTMSHAEGWDFCQIGKHLERADCTSRILDVKYHILLPSGERVGGNLDTVQWMAVLRSCSALEAYTKLHVGEIAPWKVAEFLILNDQFPRAVRFCIHRFDAALHRISGVAEDRYSCEAERLSGRLRGEVDYTSITEIFQQHGLHQYLDRMQKRLLE
ncbi:MAG: alpha-E domain-containing protein, partial [Verrucomicrobia bacterium]|nr:alpha-E domain-containing protein [Verrucomicrobiota bacterium]